MSISRVVICNVAIGHWYPLGSARLIQKFRYCETPGQDRCTPNCTHGLEVQSWVNVLPPGAPDADKCGAVYVGYCAKPFAVKYAMDQGAEIVILLDASFYPTRNIQPLIDYVAAHGYYAALDGFTIGQWCNDETLGAFGVTRERMLFRPGIASGCVSFDLRRRAMREVVAAWAGYASLIPGPHSNTLAGDKQFAYRNPGWCSDDPRCLGHRHDQSVLSLLLRDCTRPDNVPRFSAYAAAGAGWPEHTKPNQDTVLLCAGGL